MNRSRIFILFALLATAILHHYRTKRPQALTSNEETSPLTVTQTAEKIAPAKASPTTDNHTREVFAEMVEHTLSTLPTVAVIQDHPEASFEFPPKELLQSSESLGRIAEALKEEPGLAPQGMAFYTACAKREDLLTAVRAVCLRDLHNLARRSKLPTDESLAALPPDLQHLAHILPR